MVKRHHILSFLVLSVFAAASSQCEAATSITISSVGGSSYSVTTTDLPDASGMDLTISYNSDYLKDPKIVAGALISGALMVPNTATTGVIRIGIASGGTIRGSGELVSLSFTKTGKNPAPQPQLSASVYSTDYSRIAVSTAGSGEVASAGSTNTTSAGAGNPGTATSAVSTGTATSAATSAPASISSVSTVGSISLSQEQSAGISGSRDQLSRVTGRGDAETSTASAAPDVVAGGGSSAARESAVTDTKRVTASGMHSALESSRSVLDRFRTYTDSRSVKRLSALFDDSALRASGVVQSPAIVVSDGKSHATVTVDMGKETDSPSFSLRGANQKSLHKVSGNKWELVVVPQKGKYDVRLSVLLKGKRVEIPLVVIPPLGRDVTREFAALTAADLDMMLMKAEKNKKPAYDLNADTRQDYIDDYILVGHWLLKQSHRTKSTVRKPAAVHK